MAWNSPITWEADHVVTASEFNSQLRDNLNVLAIAIDTSTGKIVAISSTYFASLDGSALTGVAKTASANTLTAKNNFNSGSGRVVLPVGADKWAT